MITKSEMLPSLVVACPSFAREWEEHKREYSDEEDYLPYLALSALSRHVIDLHFAGDFTEVRSVFEAIERLHTDGDQYVRQAATIGFLEAIQNQVGHKGKDPELFRQYFGPVSEGWWDQLNLFWDGKIKYVGETLPNKLR